jgi:pimeloyl-ACP methyl ester carboxylesterase
MKAFKSKEGRQAVIGYYDMLLEKLAVPKEGLRIDTRCVETYILAAGDKCNPPLIMLHGSSMNSVMWSSDIERLYASHRIYAPDILGEPGKSDEEQRPFDTDDYTDWLCDVMEALNIARRCAGPR